MAQLGSVQGAALANCATLATSLGDAKRTLRAVAVAQDRSDLILRYAAKFASLLRHHGAIELFYALVADTEEAFRKAAL